MTWVSDAFLVSHGLFDESKGHAYNPAEYTNHGDGIFFIGIEASGAIYAYALDHATNGFTKLATIASGFVGVMALEFDRELGTFWAVCDNGCNGRSATLAINAQGRFAVTHVFERPAGMANLNNEAFAMASQAECASNLKPAFWADDGDTSTFSLRQGTVTCTGP